MGVTTLTCYRLDCDGCGKPVTGEDVEGYSFAPHGDTPGEVLGQLYGDPDVERDDSDGRLFLDGQQLDDGTILCGRCNAARLMAVRGHNWSEWQRCCCYDPKVGRRLIARHDTAGGCPEYRTCDRPHCAALEERPARVVAS